MTSQHMPSAPLLAITFVSAASSLLDVVTLRALCQQWLELCVQNEVTGLVLYRDGSFIGYLEGEAAAASEVFAVIVRDPRHTLMREVERRLCDRREFRTWSMHDRFPLEPEAPSHPTPGRDLLRAMWHEPQ